MARNSLSKLAADSRGCRIKSDEADPEALALWRDKKFRMFVYAVTGAYSGILIRCIYRYDLLPIV